MIVLTVFNHAGGAGKTSITREVGFEFAQRGLRVLLIDLDPQANLTGWLGVSGVRPEQTVYDVAVEGQALPLPLHVHDLDLIPSHVSLALAEGQMMGRVGAHTRLRRALEDLRDRYDVVLIDSPPSLGQLSILGALAADQMVVPVPTRQKGLDALPGLREAFEEYRQVRPDLRVAIYVPTLYDGRRLHDREVLAELQAHLSPLSAPVPQREAVWLDSTTAGQPVGVYAPGSPVHRDVQRLADDVARAADIRLPEGAA
ncbi:ATPase involved in plasmide/chromosome partitioning, ParA/Soj-like protein (plasmid) [Deinococcus geothermalis DSM 11300]|uniref:ATPase involved in plasmide/chromosome partitioning, ParA/Soj-like protein n=1 Tax=Deinococcus geothermalis (strain DSM 11300 / CIP 105573 / AG-3a) TaxID=319795 RepID=Q1J3M3_DEIGD|nr:MULTISPECIES: ParA family protein [Deinococcus]ABF43911.1 ATPase involved in plasmide/chromosome partitioning, ParA/Soj-like protein [Deinococcus geothermalis DSM 11300]MBI0446042.1 ParA family protein [Deinococcus sp. DB0503]TDE85517.1 ParA family protein [Deinococcus sp. S9]